MSVERDIERIEGLIRQCLPIPQKLYSVAKRLKTKEEVEEYFPGFLAFLDCTEQQVPRPKNKVRRRVYYSDGKRKKRTVKNLYTSNQSGLIIYKKNVDRQEESMTTTFTKRIILTSQRM